MKSAELEESLDQKCSLYDRWSYESEYLSLYWVTKLSEEELREQRERDKEDFLDRIWLSPLAGGLAGNAGLDEFNRLSEFARKNQLCDARSWHDYEKLEEAIREAVEDDLLIPVIDQTDGWGGGYAGRARP